MKKIVRSLALAAIASASFAGLSTFDAKTTGPNNYYLPGTPGNYDWQDGGATFNMNVTEFSWNGFTYSDVNNPTNGGWENQFAVYGDGADFSGTGSYAVGYVDAYNAVNPTVNFAYNQTVNGLFVNNTAYTAFDMIDGSPFSKQFTTNDWFSLSIEGFNSVGGTLGTVDINLADFAGFTDGDNKNNYIVNDWTYVDLTSLGDTVRSLEFTLSSSDTGLFGMNTPAYFAVDNIDAIPEPATGLFMLVGMGWLIRLRRNITYRS